MLSHAFLLSSQARSAGQIRSLGVSNYAKEDLEELMETATVVPAINQIEINPFLYRRQTIDHFQSKGVKMQSYRTLRDGKAFSDPTILGIAQKHGKSAAQVLGRWCVQHGFIAIPKSVKRERMAENMDVFTFDLDAEDMASLDSLTTKEAIGKFAELYRKCVVRDTPVSPELARSTITED
jgi:diketogulonate reductase-like aldo/keto reductase